MDLLLVSSHYRPKDSNTSNSIEDENQTRTKRMPHHMNEWRQERDNIHHLMLNLNLLRKLSTYISFSTQWSAYQKTQPHRKF